jgi:hypothetical protein
LLGCATLRLVFSRISQTRLLATAGAAFASGMCRRSVATAVTYGFVALMLTRSGWLRVPLILYPARFKSEVLGKML